MSHIYSFAFISMFIYFSKQYFLSFQRVNITRLALILGIIILIRPVNGLIVLTWPFAARNFSVLRNGFLTAINNKIRLILSFLMLLGILSLQLIIYKISTGTFLIYTYEDEGFNFLNPQIINILFSYKKGLFLYTPLFLLSLTGGIFLWKSSKFEFYSWFGFFILITYVFSSWWMWYYGGSFSSRVYVEYIPLFMVLLALALNKINQKNFKILFATIIILITIVCQIQTYQYRYYHIHWSDMNKEKYWDVFLRIDKLINK